MEVEDIPDSAGDLEVAFEDARLTYHDNRIVAVLSRSHRVGETRRAYLPYLGWVDLESRMIRRLPFLHTFESPQKNWNPISVDGHLFLEYSFRPRSILRWEKGDGRAESTGVQRWEMPYRPRCAFVRGSAPAVDLGPYFLGSYHTLSPSERDPCWTYYHLFALLSKESPFMPLAITPEMKLVSDEAKSQVQFLAGLVFDSDTGILTGSYGVADYDNYIATFRLEDILQQMIPLSPVSLPSP